MAYEVRMSVTGPNIGTITGTADATLGLGGMIVVHALDHLVHRKVEPGGGLGAGREHSPVVVTKNIDVSSPKLFEAMGINEPLTVELNFPGDRAGMMFLEYRVILTGAQIVGIKTEMLNKLYTENAELPPREKVTIVYQSISWEMVQEGNDLAQDTVG